MKKLKIMIASEDGTILDSTEVELMDNDLDLPDVIRRSVQSEVADMNWPRISNILGSE